MEFKKFETEHKGLKLKIEEDLPEVGAYLLVFENGKCTCDYLQDTIKMCMDQAYEQFEVPLDNWIKIETQ